MGPVAKSGPNATGTAFRRYSVAGIFLAIGVGWILAGYLGRVAEKGFKEGVDREATLIASYLKNDLDDVENAAIAISQADQVLAVLATGAPADLERANRLLDRVNKSLEMSACYLLDETGLTVASSNRNEKNGFVGKSFADRPYFRGAMAGRLTPYFALGRMTAERGYYAAAPVVGRGGAVIGVIVVKRNLAPIGEFFRKYTRAFLVSPEGIVFMSSRSDLLYRAFWPVEEKVRTDLRASRQFGNLKFEPLLAAEPQTGMYVRFEDTDLYVQRLPIGHEGWTLLTMEPPDVVSDYRRFGILLTLVFGILLQCLVFALWQRAKSLATARELLEAEDELKEYAQRVDFVLEGSNDATWEWDLVTNLGVLNAKHHEMLERAAGEGDFTMSDFWKTIHPADASIVENKIAESMADKDGRYEAHYRMVSRSGKIRHVLGRGKVVRRDEEGRPTKMAGVITDVTEMKTLADEASRLKNLESIALLAGGLAHDFNNMLNVIEGNVKFARMLAEADPTISEPLSDAEEACDHAKELGIRLQALSQGGGVVKEPITVADLVEEVAAALFKGSTLSHRILAADDTFLAGADLRQIRQLFGYVLTNAKEAMSDGGTLEIGIDNYVMDASSEMPLRAGSYLRIAFEDDGKGIPEEHLPKVFEPYFSTKDTYSQRGMGLGLSLARAIVKRHGGHVAVASEMGVGTLVTVYLPASEETARVPSA